MADDLIMMLSGLDDLPLVPTKQFQAPDNSLTAYYNVGKAAGDALTASIPSIASANPPTQDFPYGYRNVPAYYGSPASALRDQGLGGLGFPGDPNLPDPSFAMQYEATGTPGSWAGLYGKSIDHVATFRAQGIGALDDGAPTQSDANLTALKRLTDIRTKPPYALMGIDGAGALMEIAAEDQASVDGRISTYENFRGDYNAKVDAAQTDYALNKLDLLLKQLVAAYGSLKIFAGANYKLPGGGDATPDQIGSLTAAFDAAYDAIQNWNPAEQDPSGSSNRAPGAAAKTAKKFSAVGQTVANWSMPMKVGVGLAVVAAAYGVYRLARGY